jgi:hypothetical protein
MPLSLNAMANHGILPRDGKRISYRQLRDAIVNTYNLSYTASEAITDSAFWFANGRDWVNVSDLCTHNVIEHDGSFTRASRSLYQPYELFFLIWRHQVPMPRFGRIRASRAQS